MIPRRVFWGFDLLAMSVAFAGARVLTPWLQRLLIAGPLRRPWLVNALSIPPAETLEPFPPLGTFLWVLFVMVLAVLAAMEALDGYRSPVKQSLIRIVATAAASSLLGLSLVALVSFSLRDERWSRLFVFSFSFLCVVTLSGYRLAYRRYRRTRIAAGLHAKRVAFVGPTPAIEHLVQHFAERVTPTEYEFAGYFRITPDQPRPRLSLDREAGRAWGLPLLGDVDELSEVLVHLPIHEVVAVPPTDGADWLRQIMEDCDYFRVTLRIVPEALLFGDLRDLKLMYHSDPLQIPEIVLKPPYLDSDALFIKRLIDIVVSGTLLMLLSPLLLLVALAIKLTTPRLSVLYPWRVIGYQGKPFTGYKFTTMVADADERKAGLMDRNEMTGPVFKIKDDPRVTRLGRVLRCYSINELPQLWSVLKGDMSLVGPRPAGPHELKRYELWHKRKLCVRPGITCLWQVRGRNRVSSFDEWVRMDLEYIDNWSLWLDFKILLRTAWVVAAGSGY